MDRTTVRHPHMDMVTTVRHPHMDRVTTVTHPHMDRATTVRHPHMDRVTTVRHTHMDRVTTVRHPTVTTQHIYTCNMDCTQGELFIIRVAEDLLLRKNLLLHHH